MIIENKEKMENTFDEKHEKHNDTKVNKHHLNSENSYSVMVLFVLSKTKKLVLNNSF